MGDNDILEDVMSDFGATNADSSSEGGEDIVDQLERLAALQERGVLSVEELEQAKGILLGSHNTSDDPTEVRSPSTHDLREQDFSAIKQEILSIYDVVRDDLEDLRNKAMHNPDQVFDLGEFDKNPIIEILEEGQRQVEGVLLLSKIKRNVIQQAEEANKDGMERISELFQVYEAGELREIPEQTAEETLFEKTVEVVDTLENMILDITLSAIED